MGKEKFLKFSDGKPRHSLIPAEVLTELAKVLTMGAEKYGANNWKRCKDTNLYIDALERHLQAHRSGERVDTESGYLHLSHVLCNAAFLVYLELQKDKNATK